MNIQGLQKLTLLDYPGHTACTVFTGGCNMRCPFCHNSSLVMAPEENERIDESAVYALLEKRKGILDGVAVTGGEPLLQKDIAVFLSGIKSRGFDVKLDTNGSFPGTLAELIKDGLVDYVAMDVKNSPSKYAETAGIKNFDVSKIEKSIDIIMSSGIKYEFRTTVCAELHSVGDISELSLMIKGADRYFLQPFKDSGAVMCEGFSAPDENTLNAMRLAALENVKECGIRGI